MVVAFVAGAGSVSAAGVLVSVADDASLAACCWASFFAIIGESFFWFISHSCFLLSKVKCLIAPFL